MSQKTGTRIQKKTRTRIKNSLFGTLTTVLVYGILFLIQFFVIYYAGAFLNEHRDVLQYAFFILDFTVALHILNDGRNDPVYKMAFLFTIVVLPVFGAFLYVLSKRDILRRWFSRRFETSKEDFTGLFHQEPEILEEIRERDPLFYNTARFLWNEESFPAYRNGDAHYFPLGEDYFEQMLKELESAKKYIFMEYFIVEQGYMLDRILDIVKRKIDEGVEVRFIFDGTSVLTKVPLNFRKEMEKLGIRTKVFKPIIPVLSLYQNHRDHRKILVIDNRVAFTGGINIADEYINAVEVYGHWKDTGIAVYGAMVRSFTNMFLAMWGVSEDEPENYRPYLLPPDSAYAGKHSGYVVPFGDDPYGKNRVGKEVYNDMINQAVKYLHITTPYLILDEETQSDLIHLAQSGVEVKIITPHIPDKRLVFLVTRSHYKVLLDSGVEIYEYTPGFIHAKNFSSDDTKCVVGTINCDYRSLFLHFECGAYFYDREMTAKVEADFQETLKMSMPFTREMCEDFSLWRRAAGRVLRIFAPMM
ncbi:cardiolipin synthase [Peptoniphilus ivorii]|uniref:cardiolipin synthase n=1 Tax=Aedoeadaptatus ivorii TaxID=54006 RepID=UPI00278B16FC|nr:cardiolipin synthase [Peptoniphilus ivorii]MDQ0508565.1 cardiolipin synthase [Peptoniphilus ivorii]